MANLSGQPYPERQFNLSGLNGITDKQLEQHYKLYAGYVANTNKLNEQLAELIKAGDTMSPKFGELTRRMGFEYNGMRLHEYYFENMSSSGGSLEAGSKFGAALAESFGDIETWRTDFTSIGKMRGVGWAVLARDPLSGKLSNHWITLHEEGNVVGFTPILVMDVWEHAYVLQFGAQGRKAYVDAFFKNVDWSVVGKRLK